jgi:hypothetical protein
MHLKRIGIFALAFLAVAGLLGMCGKSSSAVKLSFDAETADFACVQISADWFGDQDEDRPSEFVMQLWQDDVLYEEFALSAKNNYSKIWTALEKGHEYEFRQPSGVKGYFLGEIRGDVESGFTLLMKKAPNSETAINGREINEIAPFFAVMGILTLAGGIALRGLFVRR